MSGYLLDNCRWLHWIMPSVAQRQPWGLKLRVDDWHFE